MGKETFRGKKEEGQSIVLRLITWYSQLKTALFVAV